MSSRLPSSPSSTAQATGQPAPQPRGKTWVQSGLAIAAGYLLLALGVIAIQGVLALQGRAAFTPILFVSLALVQLSLATAGGYTTALLAPHNTASSQSLTRHGYGLAALVLLLWLLSAIANQGLVGQPPEPWSSQLLNLATALIGIGTGTWLRLRQVIQPSA